MTNTLKKILPMALTSVGAILLAVSVLTPLGNFNEPLLASLVLIIAGISTWVWQLKKAEKY